jgi:hypothetical protein
MIRPMRYDPPELVLDPPVLTRDGHIRGDPSLIGSEFFSFKPFKFVPHQSSPMIRRDFTRTTPSCSAFSTLDPSNGVVVTLKSRLGVGEMTRAGWGLEK